MKKIVVIMFAFLICASSVTLACGLGGSHDDKTDESPKAIDARNDR